MSIDLDILDEPTLGAQSQIIMRQKNSFPTAERFQQRDLVLRHAMRACSLPDHDRLGRIVQGLGQILGWRWVGAGRLNQEQGRVDVVAWWKEHSLGRAFNYSLAGSPCQVAINSRDFCLYADVRQRFPDWGLHDTLNPSVYCAMPVLHGGKVTGHIFALHDDNSVDVGLMEDTLRVVASFLSGVMAAKPTVQPAKTQALQLSPERDRLTGLPQQDALENDIRAVNKAFQECLLSDALLVLASPQGLKVSSNANTLAENNALIAWFVARLNQLSRPMDQVYRIGEHRFAWLIPNAGCGQSAWLIDELRRLRLLFDNQRSQFVELSTGHASLTETHALSTGLLQLAAQRLDQQINAQTVPISRNSCCRWLRSSRKRWHWPKSMDLKHCY